MKICFYPNRIIITWILFQVLALLIHAEGVKKSEYKYISPLPGSRFIMPHNNIALRHGDILDMESAMNLRFDVNGTSSGRINGRVVLSEDGRTILFLPERPFAFGEEVHVETTGEVMTGSELLLENVDFTFCITAKVPELPEEYQVLKEIGFQPLKFPGTRSGYTPDNSYVNNNNLPEDFPGLTVEVLNESFDNGYYFVSPFGYWGWFPDNTPYLIIFDDHATPVFYQRLEYHGYDFKRNANGLLSFMLNEWPVPHYKALDSSGKMIDTYTMQNGYLTDFHEFFMLENSHVFIMAYDPQIVDMSQVVPGGVEDAIVIGWVFQELDVNKNVVFQWRSWDHYDILDAEGYVNLTSSTIDLIHGNAIELTPDNALLLSPRNLNEITKIDRNTGEIIWRFNGNNNMFGFINDTLGFSWQHDCRVMGNGNVSIFDNGSYHPEPQYSSVVEYALDEENFTATLVRRLRNEPDIFGTIMGSAREMPNGNMVTGWGSGEPGITEFDTGGNMASSYYFAGINYRAYRHHWSTDYFNTDAEDLDFGYIWMEDQKTKTIKITNNQDVEITLTSYHLRGDKFMVETPFPILLPAGGQASLEITFIPEEAGSFTDVLTLNSDINNDTLVRRIARQVNLAGNATPGQGTGDRMPAGIVAGPNPVKDLLKISSEIPDDKLLVSILNAAGQEIMNEYFTGAGAFAIPVESLQSGLYVVELRNAEGALLGVLKMIKQ